MTKSKRFALVLLALILPGICAAQTPERNAYVQAYSKHLLSNTSFMAKAMAADGMSPDKATEQAQAFMQHAIGCHVDLLNEYPNELQQVMFQAVKSGGSYPDAESALKIAVSEAQFDGDMELIEGFSAVTDKVAECVRNPRN